MTPSFRGAVAFPAVRWHGPLPPPRPTAVFQRSHQETGRHQVATSVALVLHHRRDDNRTAPEAARPTDSTVCWKARRELSVESDQRGDGFMQLFDQFWIHVFVLVGDVQDMERFALNSRCEFSDEPGLVLFLHDKDHVSPPDVVYRDLTPSGRTRSCGPNGKLRMLAPNSLGRRAAPLILATNEQNVQFLSGCGLGLHCLASSHSWVVEPKFLSTRELRRTG